MLYKNIVYFNGIVGVDDGEHTDTLTTTTTTALFVNFVNRQTQM